MPRPAASALLLLAACATDADLVPEPSAAAATVPAGYRAEVFLVHLTYPTSIEFDAAGNAYVAEAGYAPGDPAGRPRLLKVTPDGAVSEFASDGLIAPVNDLLWHDGKLYVSHRGRISSIDERGRVHDLVTGLPSDGDHHNNQLTAGPDRKLYFGQGTVTNSGIVGLDNFEFGWTKSYPNLHDVPAKDLRVRAVSYETSDPRPKAFGDVRTSAFQPFGTAVSEAETVDGDVKANGTILRMDPDGSDLEVHAWGLRNPYGLIWTPDGRLFASENGFDARGSRPIEHDPEDLYLIREGAWYGWPDFAAGIPVTDPRFRPADGPAPKLLLEDPPGQPELPLMTFPAHSAAAKLAVAPSGRIGKQGDLFLAFFGPMTPLTGTGGENAGRHVLRIDPDAKTFEVFFGQNLLDESRWVDAAARRSGERPPTHGGITAGPRRPIDVQFGPDGSALYVVDFGTMSIDDAPRPLRGTGLIWRIVPADSAPLRPPSNLSARLMLSQR